MVKGGQQTVADEKSYSCLWRGLAINIKNLILHFEDPSKKRKKVYIAQTSGSINIRHDISLMLLLKKCLSENIFILLCSRMKFDYKTCVMPHTLAQELQSLTQHI